MILHVQNQQEKHISTCVEECDKGWKNSGININGQQLFLLRFADDIVIMAETLQDLKLMLDSLETSLGGLAAGFMTGWSSPAVYKISQENNTDCTFSVSDSQGVWVSSLPTLGGAAACFPIGLVMDAVGRRLSMLLLVLPFTLGWLLIIFAPNIATLMAGRFITGVAGGAFCVTVPTYTSEIAQDSIRGTLGCFFQVMFAVGILFAYAIGSYVSLFSFNVVCTCMPIIFGAVFCFMPESPNFLVVKVRIDEARNALTRLRGNNFDVDSELYNLRAKADEARASPVSFANAITKRTAQRALLICFTLMFLHQMSGINAVVFNMSDIFASANAAVPTPIALIIIGVISVIATLSSSVTIDRLGRRVLLLFSTLVMCICLTALGVYYFLQDAHGADASIVTAIYWLPLLSLSLFIVAFSVGLGPIAWLMAGELCNIDIKAFVGSTAGVFNWLLAFTVTSTFNYLNASIGRGQVFWLYAGIMLLGFVFILLVVPETKGRSLDEVQVLLGAEPRPQVQQSPEKV